MNEHQKFGNTIYPIDAWRVCEDHFMVEAYKLNETIFSLGNGYLGVRGGFEEGFSGSRMNGTYINGFYEIHPFDYPDFIYANPEYDQFMVNVADAKIIRIEFEGEPLCITQGALLQYNRCLDMQNGTLERNFQWMSPSGKKIDVSFRRIVSFVNSNLYAIRCVITPHQTGMIKIISAVDGQSPVLADQENTLFNREKLSIRMNVELSKADGHLIQFKQRCIRSHLAVACAAVHIMAGIPGRAEASYNAIGAGLSWSAEARAGEPVTLEKYIAYVTSKDESDENLLERATQIAEKVAAAGWDVLRQGQQTYLEHYWQGADIEIEGDPALQQGVRFNTFHLLQSVGRDGKTNIAAKGLTGEGYSGHYFWDSEGFAVPFFLYHSPDIARALLEYRYFTLDGARERARLLSHAGGALYPWRTINGKECSSYYPAGTAQYHINADIALAIEHYYEATGDNEFLVDKGAEILFETARIWASVGWYAPSKGGKYSIPCVTGPDEYTVLVDNNAYTNYMAREHLHFACRVYEMLKTEFTEDLKNLIQKINLSESEIADWQCIVENIYLPYEATLGIIPQDDGFMAKPEWPFKSTPLDEYPLQNHHHMLIIYRHRVCKQADTVLAEYVLNDQFSLEQKRRDFDFYEPITVHDSSLSACIHCIMASEVGYPQKAYDYFIQTARLDLDNCQGNSELGIHVANMAGTWLCMVNGFGGMRISGGHLSFRPRLPDQWQGFKFKIWWKGSVLSVNVQHSQTTYRLMNNKAISFSHFGKDVDLTEKQTLDLTNE